MDLEKFLQLNYGYNPDVKNKIKSNIQMWRSWYKGNVASFHNYFIYNGDKKIKQHRYTMNMAKEITEDWADLIWSEKCKISVENEESQNQFEELVNKLDLYSVINQAIEKANALGTVGLVAGVYDIKSNEDETTLDVSESKVRIDLVNVDNIFPLTWNNKEITECAFGSVEYIKGKQYVVLSVHQIKEATGNYVIKNHLFEVTNGTITEIEMDDTLKEFDTKSKTKWFSIFKPLITNNIYENTPFGISLYANAIDNLKACDIPFDALKDEVKNGRKRTFVRADLLKYDSGEGRLTFDPEDTTIYQLPQRATKDDLIQSDTDDLRVDSLIQSINTNLNILASKVGFGQNYYHFDGQTLSTATQVVSSNSKMFRRKKKLEVGYESAIYDLVNAICYASTAFGHMNINTEGLVIQFDDSIIEDKEAESIRAGREVSNGILSKVEYRMKIFGETEEIAKQKIAQIESEEPTVDDLFGKDKTNSNSDNKKEKSSN